MTRRAFLSLTAVSSIWAKENFTFKHNLYVPKDSLFTPKKKDELKNIFIPQDKWQIFVDARNRLRRVKRHVGYGNFNILSFDHALHYARNYSSIGAFSKDELALMDELFYEDPTKYGFYGKQTCFNITNKVSKKDAKKYLILDIIFLKANLYQTITE